MQMKIGVFGRESVVKRVQQLIPETSEIELLPFIYTKAEETVDLFQTVFQCDVYLFTEYASYLFIKDTIDKKRLPAVTIELDSYRMIASLYRLQRDAEDKQLRVALDVFDEVYLNEVVQELKLDDQLFQTYLHPENEEPNMEQVISYYKGLWEEKAIDYALTSSEEITEELEALAIPARTIAISESALLRALKQAASLIQLSDSKNNLLVTGYVKVKGIDEETDLSGHRLDIYERVKKILKKFTEKNDATFVETRERQFLIYGSDKLLTHLRDHYRTFPLLQEIKQQIALPIHLGFGLGLHAAESNDSATIAIKNCAHSENSICYIVNERQEVIGPIGVKREIDTSRLYHALIHHARLNNELSYHFIDFITDRNNEPFSTHDVATFYQVTKRSAERTVNKLLTGDVIKIAGEERPYKKGRPRKLFTLNQ
jgi:hypothetical protein